MSRPTQPLDEASTSSSTFLSAATISLEDEKSLKHPPPSCNVLVGTAGPGANIGTGTIYQTNITNYYNEGNKNALEHLSDNEDLKYILEEEAKRISSNINVTPIMLQHGNHVEPVSVELKSGTDPSKIHDLDVEGHYNRREDFEKIMESTKGDMYGNMHLAQIFSTAFTEAKTRARNEIQKNPYDSEYAKAIEKYAHRHGNIVAIIGHAGIGKTTLAKQIVQLSLDRKLYDKNEKDENDYIFFVAFRRVNFQKECSLLQLLMSGIRKWVHSMESDYLWIQKLQDNPNVVIVFDGLDEANTDQFSETDKQCSISEKCNPVDFVKNIFMGNIFPLAKKVVTSRPRQFFELNREFKPQFEVHILGLKSSSQEELGKQICKSNYPIVSNFLHAHPDVLASCFIPAKCFIIMAVLSKSIKDGRISIHSLTEIFVAALYVFVSTDHFRSTRKDISFKNEMKNLALLAWKGFLVKKIIFSEEDVEEAGISKNVFQAFLHTFRDESDSFTFNLIEGEQRSSFSHLIWQELFVALYVVFLLKLEDFKNNLENLTEARWEVVSKFIFGLLRPTAEKKVKLLFALDETQKKDLQEKKKLLLDKTIDLMKEVPFEKSPHPTLNFLLLCNWIQEAGSKELNDCIAPILPKEIKVGEKLLPIDVTGLGYVLQIAKRPFSSKIEPLTDLRMNSQEIFLKDLASLNVKVSELDFDQMKFEPNNLQLLADSFENLHVLKLESCGISSKDAETIGRKLASLEEPMQQLSLRFNKIGDDGAKGIAIGLYKLMALNLCDCKINADGAIALGKSLRNHPGKMTELDLSENTIGDEGISAIAEGLQNVESLNVSHCDISNEGAAAIGRNLTSLSQAMKELNLHGNFIGDDGAKSIADGIQNIKHVVVNCCNISLLGVNVIKEKLKSFSTKVTGDEFSSDDDSIDLEED